MMGWVKIDPSSSGNRFILGQEAIYLRLTSSNKVYARVNGYAIHSPDMPNNQWFHVTLTYSNANNSMNLYINGEEVSNRFIDQSIDPDNSLFTMGKRAGAKPFLL